MRKTRLSLTLSITLVVATICKAQYNFENIHKDFEKLLGTWQGSLTYLDYSSGKPYTMLADIEIKRGKKANTFVLSKMYPNEVNANAIDTISISSNGKYIDKELVKSRRKLLNEDIEIITEVLGKDGNDNKPATIRHTYIFSTASYKNIKDVLFIGETKWINRHQYSYKKKPSR